MYKPDPTLAKSLFFLQRMALLLFAILPISSSFLVQLGYLFHTWTLFQSIRISLLVLLLFVPFIVIVFNEGIWNTVERKRYVPLLWIVLLSITLRLIILPLLSTNFTSDFEDIHNFAVDVVSGHPYANLSNYPSIPWATHLNMTGLTMSVVYRIFGASFATAKMFMLVLATITVWLIYLTGKELADVRIGFMAASLYGTLPSLVCYTGVLTGEHFALPLVTLAILLYVRAKKSQEKAFWIYAAGYIFCGIAIGLVDWFRPGGIILLIALVITDLLYCNKANGWIRYLIPLALFILSYVAVSNLAVTISERFFHQHVMSNTEKSGYFILIGLNPESQGRINLDDRGIAFEAYDRFKDDSSAANQYLIQMAIERLKGHSIWQLFRSKFVLLWANHEQLFQVALNGSNDAETVAVLSTLDSLITLLLTISIGINLVSSLINRSEPGVFAMQLFILGFALGSLILEAQNRYAIITFPYMILLGSLGIHTLVTFTRKASQAISN